MKITIKGLPISKMRPRLGKNKVYDPQNLIKRIIKSSIEKQYLDYLREKPENPFNFSSADAYSVDMSFYFPPPKTLSKVKRSAKLSNIEPCLVRNDLDNLEKFYLDCANGILFLDDHQIVQLSSKKLWAEEARVEMIIMPFSIGEH